MSAPLASALERLLNCPIQTKPCSSRPVANKGQSMPTSAEYEAKIQQLDDWANFL